MYCEIFRANNVKVKLKKPVDTLKWNSNDT